MQDPFEVVSGYYLNGTGYEDVAVLWVAQFLSMIDPTNPAQMDTLRNVTRDFLTDAVATGKKRLVLDVSGNIGGISNSPIEIVRSRISNLTSFSDLLPFTDSKYQFDRLFPSARTKVEMHVNYELTPPVKLFTDSFGAIPLSAVAPKANDSAMEQEIKMKALYNDYNYRTWEDVNGSNFTSLAEFVPPVEQSGANFTALFQLPLNNTIWQLTQNFIPFGYGNYYNASYQDPFKAKNVVIISDGTCASGKLTSQLVLFSLTIS